MANEQERSIRLAGLPMTIDTLKQHTVSEIVIRYRDHVTPTKEGSAEENARLNKFLKHPMCAKSLAYVSKQDERHVTDYELPPLPGVPVVEPVPAVPMVEF
jgi:hypothetical protein